MLKTEQGYREPSVRQIAIFLHNRVGQLGELLRQLEQEAIRVLALSVTDSVDFAMVRIVVDDVTRALHVLKDAEFSVAESQVLGVQLSDDDSSLLQVCRTLIGAEVNIHYAYPMFRIPGGKNVVLIHVDDLDFAREALLKREFELIDDSDLTPAE